MAAYATVVLALLMVYLVTGSSEIYIDGAPSRAEQLVLAVIALARNRYRGGLPGA